MLALHDCIVSRSHDGNIEFAEGRAAHRAFPARVSERFGVCLKTGPSHWVHADGKDLIFPEASICVRPAGCVWSTAGTGPVGFLSLDIDAALLPNGIVLTSMRFASRHALPRLGDYARMLQRVEPSRTGELVGSLLLELAASGVFSAEELRERARHGTAARAREALEMSIATSPTLEALATTLGTNRFALLRDFKRSFGITPHAFLLRLRIERARERIARGADLSEVALALGFADQPHFSRMFKRVVGVTPGQYARCTRIWAVSAR